MIRRVLIGLFTLLSVFILQTGTASAASLKIAPRNYDTSLQKGEVKKGFVDVSNPGNESVKVSFSVEAFRQIDDDGSLEFYRSEQLSSGVKLDYDAITIGPREAYRVYFLLDGSKLPEGDIFAALFASTVPKSQAGSAQAVRVGTLLTIQNGTPVEHTADVVGFETNWLQTGDALSATIRVKNPSDPGDATGFYPTVRVATAPYGGRDVKGPLLFAGRTRVVEYLQPGNYFGPIWLSASVNDSSKGQLVFAVTGYWRWLAPISVVALVVAGVILQRSGIMKRTPRSLDKRKR